jgi:general secretion pathway protein K
MTPPVIKDSERGAALLTVLLLVSVIAVIAATSLDRLKLATRLTGNVAAMAQARAFLFSAEDVALAQIAALTARNPAALTLDDDWQGKARRIPLDGGALTITLSDGGACFNLNAVVAESAPGVLTIRKEGHAAFLNLLGLSGIGARQAEAVAAGVVDWVDSDSVPMAGGAEDNAYRGKNAAALPPNALMADTAELRGINGMDAAAWTKIRPWVCALPVAAPVPLNINTILPEQGIILSAFAPGDMPPPMIRSILAKRPKSGYGSLVRFWEQPELAKAKGNGALVAQTSMNSRFFRLSAEADFGGMMAGEDALIAVQNGQAVLLWRAARVD